MMLTSQNEFVYFTAGVPTLEQTKQLIREQGGKEGVTIELGIPFSDPIADKPEIQDAFYQAICGGVNVEKVFDMLAKLRKEGIENPVVFRMYYNTILHYGVKKFVEKCAETRVDGLLVLDLPFVEQGEILQYLRSTDIQLLKMA